MEKLLLCECVGIEQAYLLGFPKPFGWSTVLNWWETHDTNEKKGHKATNVFQSKRKRKRRTYIESLQSQFPDFLHKLYRYATKMLGHNSNNYRIRSLMQKRAGYLFPNCPIRSNLDLTPHHFNYFFKINGGQYKSIATKPSLTEENIKARNKWARKYAQLIKQNEYICCFLDEKWFFCHTNRKKYKVLPPNKAIGETSADSFVPLPCARSRRKPCKVMVLACVGNPEPDHNFNGKIFMERVSKFEPAKVSSHSQRFTNDFKVNNLIKEGLWKDLHVPEMKSHDLFEAIGQHFEIEEYITDRCVLTYYTYARTGKTKYIKHIDLFDSEGKGTGVNKRVIYNDRELLGPHRTIRTKEREIRQLTLDDCLLQVRTKKGMLVEKDTTCDSEYITVGTNSFSY